MRRFFTALAAVVVGASTVLLVYAVDGDATTRPDETLGPGVVTVRVGVEHSEFSVAHVKVRPGTTVRFVLENHDPINHELVVGGAAVHARHRRGSEASHPPVPGEVSVGPNATGVTFHRFNRVGDFEFACHLPAHYEYGMRGTVEVIGDRS
jgi:uncharacterized cupredoxin-like copper-binding protein